MYLHGIVRADVYISSSMPTRMVILNGYKLVQSMFVGARIVSGALASADIHQLNLIMEILGTPRDEFMQKISSESVSVFEVVNVEQR